MAGPGSCTGVERAPRQARRKTCLRKAVDHAVAVVVFVVADFGLRSHRTLTHRLLSPHAVVHAGRGPRPALAHTGPTTHRWDVIDNPVAVVVQPIAHLGLVGTVARQAFVDLSVAIFVGAIGRRRRQTARRGSAHLLLGRPGLKWHRPTGRGSGTHHPIASRVARVDTLPLAAPHPQGARLALLRKGRRLVIASRITVTPGHRDGIYDNVAQASRQVSLVVGDIDGLLAARACRRHAAQ